MMKRIAFPLLALAVASGCSGRDATGPVSAAMRPSAGASASSSESRNDDNDGERSRRSGALHLTKECSTYMGRAGDFCTIASSNLKDIKIGSRIVYQEAAGPASLDTDVILYPPNSGRNIAFGHCALDFVTGLGHCTFSGGTGKFAGFMASVRVSCVGAICALDGTYSFSGKDGED